MRSHQARLPTREPYGRAMPVRLGLLPGGMLHLGRHQFRNDPGAVLTFADASRVDVCRKVTLFHPYLGNHGEALQATSSVECLNLQFTSRSRVSG